MKVAPPGRRIAVPDKRKTTLLNRREPRCAEPELVSFIRRYQQGRLLLLRPMPLEQIAAEVPTAW